MTIVRFEYKNNYHMPATGGLVFMPHRKHATNETVVLPKPFHKTLVDGVVEVDLEPTGDDWVWSVTLGDDTQFYAIPDHDGIMNHTDLIPIAPSTLDHTIEPVWWAELRQLQTFITGYIDESRTNVDKAISTVDSVHTTLQTAVTDAQRHESVAGAYSRQAQASNEQAWEASKGPDGAAQRAKDEADRAEIYRNEANNHRLAALGHETKAKEHADLSVETYEHIQKYTEGWDSLEDAITDAQTHADRSETHANEAVTAHTEAVTARNEAVTARNESVEARDESVEARDEAITARDEATHMVVNEIRGPEGPQGPMGTIELIGDNPTITIDKTVGTRVFVGDVMIHGDTGWCALDHPDLTTGEYLIRRIGDTVIIQLSDGQFDSSGNKAFPRVPSQFRPDLRVRATWIRDLSSDVGGTINISTGGYLNMYSYEEGTAAHFNTRYETSTPWPTELPGTPLD